MNLHGIIGEIKRSAGQCANTPGAATPRPSMEVKMPRANHTPNAICTACGISYYAPPNRLARTKYCSVACSSSARMRPPEERFWEKVRKTDGGCWTWMASRSAAGYGTFNLGRRGEGYALAHRYSYELARGPIPDGLDLDHLCRNRACVNPDHLEPVTPWVNMLRGELPSMQVLRSGRCMRGHKMDAENTYVHPKTGQRQCRSCKRLRRSAQAA